MLFEKIEWNAKNDHEWSAKNDHRWGIFIASKTISSTDSVRSGGQLVERDSPYIKSRPLARRESEARVVTLDMVERVFGHPLVAEVEVRQEVADVEVREPKFALTFF